MIVQIIAEILLTLTNLSILFMPGTNGFVKKVDNRDLNIQLYELKKQRNKQINTNKWYIFS